MILAEGEALSAPEEWARQREPSTSLPRPPLHEGPPLGFKEQIHPARPCGFLELPACGRVPVCCHLLGAGQDHAESARLPRCWQPEGAGGQAPGPHPGFPAAPAGAAQGGLRWDVAPAPREQGGPARPCPGAARPSSLSPQRGHRGPRKLQAHPLPRPRPPAPGPGAAHLPGPAPLRLLSVSAGPSAPNMAAAPPTARGPAPSAGHHGSPAPLGPFESIQEGRMRLLLW